MFSNRVHQYATTVYSPTQCTAILSNITTGMCVHVVFQNGFM